MFRKGSGRAKKLLLPLLLWLCLCLPAGCAASQARTGTQQEFTDFTGQIFRSEITASTLNMHYTLAHPENYGITEYPITFGRLSAGSGAEASAILENWKQSLERFEKKNLPISQQMTYDIMMDYIEREIPAAKLGLYEELLRANNGFQAQLPVLLAEYVFYDEQDIKDYLGLLSCVPDFFGQIFQAERQKSVYGRLRPGRPCGAMQ